MAKRPVPLYDFTAFGQAIKAARTERKESRKNLCDAMNISRDTLQTLRTRDSSQACKYFMSLSPVQYIGRPILFPGQVRGKIHATAVA